MFCSVAPGTETPLTLKVIAISLRHRRRSDDARVDEDRPIDGGTAGMDVSKDDARVRGEAGQLEMEVGCSGGDGACSIACHVESDLDVAKPGVFGAGNWRVFIGRGQASCHHDW